MGEFCGFCGDVGGALARLSDEGKGRGAVATGGDRRRCFLLHSVVIPCREARVWVWDVEVTSAQTRGREGRAPLFAIVFLTSSDSAHKLFDEMTYF
jgi:hypothetical protein